MSDEFSIDIVSGIDRADLMNAVDYVKQDLLSTYKLGQSNTQIELNPDSTITITSTDRKKIKNICDSFNDTLGTDGQSVTINNLETVENAISGEVRHVFNLIKGMGKDIAQAIEDDIKELKLKVKTDIHANGVKVTGSKDDMQNVINMVTTNQAKYKTPIQITNYNEEK